MSRHLLALLLLALPLPALAASRLVVHLDHPAQVTVDGQGLVTAGNRAVMNHIGPGMHTVEIRDLAGRVMDRATIEVPADADVQARWSPGAPLQVTGARVSTGAAAAPPGSTAAPPPSAAPPPGTEASAPPAEGDIQSFDMNEGSGHDASGGRERSGRAGNPDGFARAAGTAARVGASTVAPVTTTVVTTAAPAIVHGTASMVRNAEAGGAGAFRSGPGPDARQGRPIPPAAVTGFVEFQNPAGDPSLVYLEGFLIAQLGPGMQKQKVKLEVGRHLIEIMDGETAQSLYKGVVQVDKGATVVIEFTDSQPPRAVERSWAWSPR